MNVRVTIVVELWAVGVEDGSAMVANWLNQARYDLPFTSTPSGKGTKAKMVRVEEVAP